MPASPGTRDPARASGVHMGHPERAPGAAAPPAGGSLRRCGAAGSRAPAPAAGNPARTRRDYAGEARENHGTEPGTD